LGGEQRHLGRVKYGTANSKREKDKKEKSYRAK
jgi:hypothetical protein